MKKAGLLLLSGALVFAACQKDPVPSKDATLDGKTVDVSAISTSAQKLFVLNEGGLGSNNASLDFLRFQDGKYVTGSFKKMNPEIGAGLGDVGNDIAIHGDEAWIVVNNSGGNYAYVTSWAGAFATYEGYNIVDSKNCKGQVYRINLGSKKVEGTVEVGYQPEGIAVYNGKLYVANSGGISSQLSPDYAYDNTVSIIDAASFKVEKTVTVQVNLKNVYSDGKGRIYVTTLGNYNDVHSGLYTFTTAHPESVEKVADYVSVSAICGDKVYCIGTESELDWSATHVYASWAAVDGAKSAWNLTITEAPYGLAALDASTFFVSDAGDYFNPGTVACYHNGSKLWTVTAGVCPGHFALY